MKERLELTTIKIRLGNRRSTKYVINPTNACSNSTPKSTIQLEISCLIGLDDISMKIKVKKQKSKANIIDHHLTILTIIHQNQATEDQREGL